jgi:hypothetical protein
MQVDNELCANSVKVSSAIAISKIMESPKRHRMPLHAVERRRIPYTYA